MTVLIGVFFVLGAISGTFYTYWFMMTDEINHTRLRALAR